MHIHSVSLGPGGGGSPSGIAVSGNNVFLSVDCGGIRRLPITSYYRDKWVVEVLPGTGTQTGIDYDSIWSILSMEVDNEEFLFAGSRDGRLYRWNSRIGWQYVWKGNTSISSIYQDSRHGFESTLYIGTGSISMRHSREGEQHPNDPNFGRIFRFDDVTSKLQLTPDDTIKLGSRQFDTENPQLPNILKMLIVQQDSTNHYFMYVATDLGVYRAEISGNDPFSSSIVFNFLNGNLGDNCNCRSLALTFNQKNHTKRVILSTDRNFTRNTPGAIYCQEVGEGSWDKVLEMEPGKRLWDLVIDPDSSESVFACDHSNNGQLLESKNGGIDWSTFFSSQTLKPSESGSYGIEGGFTCRFVVISNNQIFVAGDNRGGIWRINRNNIQDHEYLTGTSPEYFIDYWKGKGSIDFTCVTNIALTYTYPFFGPPTVGSIYVTILDYVGMKGYFGGNHWKMFSRSEGHRATGGRGNSITINPCNSNMVFLSYTGANETPVVLGSVDGGEEWLVLADNTTRTFKTYSNEEIEHDEPWLPVVLKIKYEGNKQWLYAAGPARNFDESLGMWVKRTDITEGIVQDTWTDPRTPISIEGHLLTHDPTFPTGTVVYDMDSSSATCPTIFVGTNNGLFTSTSNGRSWVRLSGSSDWKVTKIESISSRKAFIVTQHKNNDGKAIYEIGVNRYGEQLYCELVNDTLPVRANDLLYHERALYAATRTFGIVKFDLCEEKPLLPEVILDRTKGLPTDDTFTITFDLDGNAYVGTHCFGLWKINRGAFI